MTMQEMMQGFGGRVVVCGVAPVVKPELTPEPEPTNKERFRAALLTEFQADPPQPLLVRSNVGVYVMPAKTPEQCADTFANGIIDGTAGHTGPRIARACRALGIKQTKKAIREYCAS